MVGRRLVDVAFGDGFASWQVNFSYQIDEKGVIRLDQKNDPDIVGMVDRSDLQETNIYRYGDTLYLEKASVIEPGLSFDPGTLWPFKAMTNRVPGQPD